MDDVRVVNSLKNLRIILELIVYNLFVHLTNTHVRQSHLHILIKNLDKVNK